MSNPLGWRKAAARELEHMARLEDRLQRYRYDLELSQARLRRLTADLPASNALIWAIDDLQHVIDHLDHAISALEAGSR